MFPWKYMWNIEKNMEKRETVIPPAGGGHSSRPVPSKRLQVRVQQVLLSHCPDSPACPGRRSPPEISPALVGLCRPGGHTCSSQNN